MQAEITIDIEDAFNNLSYMEQEEFTGMAYDALLHHQQQEFIAQIIEDVDDDVLIGELERRGYEVKKDD